MRGPLKVMEVKNEIQVLKELREEYHFSRSPLAQLLTGTNRSLYWNKWVMQKFQKIMTIFEKLYDS